MTIEAYHDDPVEMRKEDFRSRGNPDHVDYIKVTTELDHMRMPIGTFPVLVFSATRADPGGAQNQRYWLGLSPHSRQVVVEGGHDLHLEAPDKQTRDILDLSRGAWRRGGGWNPVGRAGETTGTDRSVIGLQAAHLPFGLGFDATPLEPSGGRGRPRGRRC